MNKLVKYLKNPKLIPIGIIGKLFGSKWMSDKVYLKKQYYIKTGKRLDIDNPKTFNEKIQWLKLHDRKDIYTKMVDKYYAKKYVSNLIGSEYIIPTLGVYEKWDDIDFSKLPNQFVIKCTHNSNKVIICKDKKNFDYKKAKKIINKCLKHNYYYNSREYPYKNINPRILIEKYMVDESGVELKDYKIFNFNGKAKLIQVDFGRFTNHKRRFYDEKWNKLDFFYNHPDDKSVKINKPKKLKKLVELSEILSQDIPFVRCDFYVIYEKIYFGEITFYPEAGLGKFKPKKWDEKLGNMIDISKIKI